jgi:phage shock protein PspC (stress-responsive transcriptional regulator)
MVGVTDGTGGKVLMRSRNGRMLAGACTAVADCFGLDVTWSGSSGRSVITGGAGVLAYLVALVIPGEGQKSSIAENIAGKKHGAWSG